MSRPTTPGKYVFADQLVEVVLENGELRARFAGMKSGDRLVPLAEMSGDWDSLEEPESPSQQRQRDLPYIVELWGDGADELPEAEGFALEDSFRLAFDKVCGDKATFVVFAHMDGDGDVLDPRNDGPGFYDDLERRALKLMDKEVPRGLHLVCTYNYAIDQR